MKTFKLQLITPEKIIFQDEVESLILPGEAGMLGILKGHEPAIIKLTSGVLIASKGSTRSSYVTASGYAEISQKDVKVMVDFAEKPETIDLKKSNSLVESANEIISNPASSQEDVISAKTTMEIELGKIKALSKINR